MEIIRILELSGPNIWTNRYALESWVDLGPYEEKPSNLLPGFYERLTTWLPSLIEHRCSEGERGGFLSRLRDGTWLGHILEHVSLELQTLVYVPVGYGRARETTDRGVYRVVIACMEPALGRACLATARRLVLAAAEDTPFDLQSELSLLAELTQRVGLSAFGRALLMAAKARGIPFRRVGELSLLGYGAEQRRIHGDHTDCSSALGATLVEDAELSAQLLRQVGVPVFSAGEKGSAEKINPEKINTEKPALPKHTVWLVGDKVLGAVTDFSGNGALRFCERVHPDIEQLAQLTARTLGLEVAAIEVFARDIQQPQERQTVVGRVESRFNWELATSLGASVVNLAADALLDQLLPPGAAPRFQLVSVSGTAGKTDVAERINAALKVSGRRVGLADQHADFISSGSTARVLMNPLLDAAVIEVSELGVLERGAPFDYCDVAVVTNLGDGDHLAGKYLQATELAKKAIRTPVDIVRQSGAAVLNWDESAVRDLAQYSKGGVVYFSAARPKADVPVEAGKRVGWCYVDGSSVWAVWQGGSPEVLVPDIETSFGALAPHQLQNRIAAVAAAWVLQLSGSALRAAWELKDVALQHATGPALTVPRLAVSNARNALALSSSLAQLSLTGARDSLGLVMLLPSDWRTSDAEAMGALAGLCAAVALVCDANSGANAASLAETLLDAARGAGSARVLGTFSSLAEAQSAVAAACSAVSGEQPAQLLIQTRSREETQAVLLLN